MADANALYDINELAELGGVSRRTVRYYVQRGLVPAPLGTGRGKHYGAEHLDTLILVRTLQEQGVSLDDIVARLAGAGESPTQAEVAVRQEVRQVPWVRIELAAGLELHVAGPARLNSATLEELGDAVRSILARHQTP